MAAGDYINQAPHMAAGTKDLRSHLLFKFDVPPGGDQGLDRLRRSYSLLKDIVAELGHYGRIYRIIMADPGSFVIVRCSNIGLYLRKRTLRGKG